MLQYLRDYPYGIIYRSLKEFNRSAITQHLDEVSSNVNAADSILVVGGHGPILEQILRLLPENKILTLDINSKHSPDLILDVQEENLEFKVKERFNFIFMLEVFEHLFNPTKALSNIYSLLEPGGKLIGSTPWIIPIHDHPHDYYRYTHYALKHLLEESHFSVEEIFSRGTYVDSVISLMYRGLRTGGFPGKLLALFAFVISKFRKNPKKLDYLDDSCIGYSFVAVKK